MFQFYSLSKVQTAIASHPISAYIKTDMFRCIDGCEEIKRITEVLHLSSRRLLLGIYQTDHIFLNGWFFPCCKDAADCSTKRITVMYTVASVGCYDMAIHRPPGRHFKDVPLKSINMQNKQNHTPQEALPTPKPLLLNRSLHHCIWASDKKRQPNYIRRKNWNGWEWASVFGVLQMADVCFKWFSRGFQPQYCCVSLLAVDNQHNRRDSSRI